MKSEVRQGKKEKITGRNWWWKEKKMLVTMLFQTSLSNISGILKKEDFSLWKKIVCGAKTRSQKWTVVLRFSLAQCDLPWKADGYPPTSGSQENNTTSHLMVTSSIIGWFRYEKKRDPTSPREHNAMAATTASFEESRNLRQTLVLLVGEREGGLSSFN